MEYQKRVMMKKRRTLDLTFPQRSQLHGFVTVAVQEWTSQ